MISGMDNVVTPVPENLHINGYFTLTGYPVIEAIKGKRYHMVTDLELPALHFSQVGQLLEAVKPGGSGI